jgi:UPF0176 protein
MSGYTIILFYKYVRIDDPASLAREQQALCERLNLKGRLIIATEGLNGTFEGAPEAIDEYIAAMQRDDRFVDIHFKKSQGTGDAMPKLSIKVRDEIVSGHLGAHDVDPTRVTGKRLTPDELHEWIQSGKHFHIIDMRNDYEYHVGHFKNSHPSGMRNFRELPTVPSRFEPLRKEPVLFVCTGGIRCEKASGYMISQGFEDAYQLEGGIVSYMEKYPGQAFQGSLYVFDQRITMHFDTPEQHTVVGTCVFCGENCERYVNCKDDVCHAHFIACTACVEKDMGRLCKECAGK